MNKKMKMALNKLATGEKGQVMILALILLVVGGLIIAPLLSYMNTGLLAGRVYEEKADELYAADAGVEDGLWQIRNDELEVLFTSPAYDQYDYATTWSYGLPEQINSKDVSIDIGNIWIPSDISVPSALQAKNIIEALKLVVTGSVPSGSDYQIKITFNPGAGEEDALLIQTLGIWLPPGFGYVVGSSNLEADPSADYYSVPVVSPHAGGQAVVWSFGGVSFSGGGVGDPFPGVIPGSPPLSSTITFQFVSQSLLAPDALAWVTTGGVGDVPFSWDADTRVYKITSIADSTTVKAYAIKSEMRELGTAIAGDYFATGNTMMAAIADYRYRDRLYEESSAAVVTSADPEVGIPANAVVAAAWLYWSGWIEEGVSGGPSEQVIFLDDASDFNSPPMDWTNGSSWSIYSGDQFRGQGESGTSGIFIDDCRNFDEWDGGNNWDEEDDECEGRGDDSVSDRTLTLKDSLDLSSYSGQTVTVSWDQDESGDLEDSDRLYFAFSGDGGSSWSSDIEAFRNDNPPSSFSYTIPDQYLTNNFKIRFFWDANNGDKRVQIDNIVIQLSGAAPDPDRTLTFTDTLDLSSYSGQTVTISWQQRETGDLESSDYLYFAFSGDGGSSWSSNYVAFNNDIGSSFVDFSYTIPSQYLTADFKMRFFWEANDTSEYVYVDNITIAVSDAIFLDDATDFNSPPMDWTNGSNWSIYSGDQFRGQGSGSTADRTLTFTNTLDLSSYSGQMVDISWQQRETGGISSSQGLYFAFYNSSGWSSDIVAFINDIGSSFVDFSYTIPDQYLTADFKMRFFWAVTDSDDYVYIDNIAIFESVSPVEGAKVDRVMFGVTGKMTQVTADALQVAPTADASGAPNSWSYSSFYDASDLVKQLIVDGDIGANGSGTYTLGHVLEGSGYSLYPTGTTGYPLATPATSQWAYAGWSLIIVYSSPDTEGHQLYLFDDLRYVALNTTVTFDISGFLAPSDTTGSHLTYFVGEGDAHYAGDNARVNGSLLSDADNPWNNVFNSYSNVISAGDNPTDGVDIDGFDMSSYINSGDTQATIELDNGAEIYNLVYIILSFRSEVTTGGTVTYEIS